MVILYNICTNQVSAHQQDLVESPIGTLQLGFPTRWYHAIYILQTLLFREHETKFGLICENYLFLIFVSIALTSADYAQRISEIRVTKNTLHKECVDKH